MNEIQTKVNQDCLSFGGDVKDVRIVEAELPVANQDAVFKRMRSDRPRRARKLYRGYPISEKRTRRLRQTLLFGVTVC